MFATARDDGRMLRSNFLISEFWDSETRTLTGWAGHRVVRGRGWKIRSQAGQSARMRSGHPQPEASYPFRRFLRLLVIAVPLVPLSFNAVSLFRDLCQKNSRRYAIESERRCAFLLQ
jgi:hypothetical protein